MATTKRKKISEERKIEKGLEGELIVQSAIKEALDILKIKNRIYNNVYLQFPSSYGSKYGFTTEIDHVVVTEGYIFVIETKNQTYYKDFYSENRNNEYWHLNDDKHTPVINPMIQNYNHKMILSEQLETDRETILQLVCLKDIPPDGTITGHKDYRRINNHFLLFNDDDFIDNLCMIFMSENHNHSHDYEETIRKMDTIMNRQFLYKDHHIENLERADKILDYQFGTRIKLDIMDNTVCPKCGSTMMVFLDEMPLYHGRKRRKHKYIPILRCSNRDCYYKFDFDRKGIEIVIDNFFSCFLPTKKIKNADIEIKTIEERLGYDMPEEYQETVYDQIQSLKQDLEYEEDKVNRMNLLVNEKYGQIKELQEKNGVLYERNHFLENELNSFKHLIGNLYKKK